MLGSRSAILLLMCGRYRLSRSKELLAEHFDVEPDDNWEPGKNDCDHRWATPESLASIQFWFKV